MLQWCEVCRVVCETNSRKPRLLIFISLSPDYFHTQNSGVPRIVDQMENCWTNSLIFVCIHSEYNSRLKPQDVQKRWYVSVTCMKAVVQETLMVEQTELKSLITSYHRLGIVKCSADIYKQFIGTKLFAFCEAHLWEWKQKNFW